MQCLGHLHGRTALSTDAVLFMACCNQCPSCSLRVAHGACRTQVLEDKRQQMNMERELLRLEEEQMQQSQRHLAQQAAEGARITAEAAALQAQVDTMAHRNRQAEVDNALRRTTVTMPAPPPDTPPHGGTMAVRGHAHLMSTPTHRSMDESMSVVQALDAQDDAAPQQRWLHPSQDRGDSGGRPSPGRYQQVRRKVQTVGVAPRAPGPARDGYSAMNVPALEIEMDRLLEASTYQALFDYDARTADEVGWQALRRGCCVNVRRYARVSFSCTGNTYFVV